MRVYGDDDGNSKLDAVADVFDEVGQSFTDKFEVLLDVLFLKGRARGHRWAATVHLERANRRHEDHGVGYETRLAALNVEELLHADVGAKARLGHDDSFGSDQFQGDRVRQDRGAAVSYVGERTRVHQNWGSLDALHQVRLDRVLQ